VSVCLERFILYILKSVLPTILQYVLLNKFLKKCPSEHELEVIQAISMAVQQGNVQCVQGAYGKPAFEELDEIFYIVKPNNIF
jgi:hypothetical protein